MAATDGGVMTSLYVITAHMKRAARVGPEAARESATGRQNDIESAATAQGGKALSMWLYNCGFRTADDTERAFAAHPEWVNA
jgi:hypothetical protein